MEPVTRKVSAGKKMSINYFNYSPAPHQGQLGRGEISSSPVSKGEMELFHCLKRMGINVREPKSYQFPSDLGAKDIVLYLDSEYNLRGVDIVMDVFQIEDYQEADKVFREIFYQPETISPPVSNKEINKHALEMLYCINILDLRLPENNCKSLAEREVLARSRKTNENNIKMIDDSQKCFLEFPLKEKIGENSLNSLIDYLQIKRSIDSWKTFFSFKNPFEGTYKVYFQLNESDSIKHWRKEIHSRVGIKFINGYIVDITYLNQSIYHNYFYLKGR